jgi:hypothetical protein
MKKYLFIMSLILFVANPSLAKTLNCQAMEEVFENETSDVLVNQPLKVISADARSGSSKRRLVHVNDETNKTILIFRNISGSKDNVEINFQTSMGYNLTVSMIPDAKMPEIWINTNINGVGINAIGKGRSYLTISLANQPGISILCLLK